MTGIGEYEAWKAKQQQAKVGAAGVVIGAQEQSPDQLAGDLNLASEFGKVTGNPVPPAPMVGEYRSVFQAAIEKKRAETILSSSPRLTEWLRNPENAGIARDDLEGLSWWETTFGATVNAGKRGLLRAGPQAKNQYFANVYAERAQDAKRSFGDILHDERTPILNAEGKEVDRAWAGPSDLLGAGYRFAASRLTNLWGQTAEENALQYQQQAGQIAQRIAQIPMSPGGEAGKKRFMEASKAEGWQAQLSALASAFGEAPGEMTSFLLQTAAESLPTMAAAAGVGAATRNPSAAAAVLGGSSFASEYGSSPVEFFKEKGIDVSTPEGAMSAIRNPDLMRDAEQRGVTRGVIIGALDGLSGGIAGTKLAESAVGNMVLQSITQAVLGAGGEAGGQLASGQQFNIAEVVLEGLAEFVSAPVEVGGMAVSRVREIQARAADAEARVGLFQQLSGQAVNSKLRARMPDRFRQFVEQATANGPVENVFVPASDFVQYFQSVGIDPETLISELDGVTMDDLDAALAGGGDLKIPTATYAAKIAGSEHDAFLMENMRFDPLDMTAREAADFNARVDEVMQEMWDEAEDIRLEDEKWRAVEGKIYDDMVSRLRIAGRSTEVATTEAMIYPAFYRVMAERSGLSTEEFLERYPLPQVQGAIPQGMQFRDVDELNRTLAELRARTAPKGPKTPLLDFIARRGGIDDVGGELKARNADGQRRPGQGRLARKLTEEGKPMPMTAAERASGNRFGWDDTAQAAVEAGFFDDNPVAIEWKLAQEHGDRVAPDMIPMLIEAIDRELAGQPAVADENAENDAALDEMERYLSEIGVSLDDSDDAIRAALEAAQAEDGRMYAQDGTLRTDSDAFKRWFGASKVVDADGKPLVVYHGTKGDVEAFDASRFGQNDSGWYGHGVYVSADKMMAEAYAGWDEMSGAAPEGGNVMPVYVSLQNPYYFKSDKTIATDTEGSRALTERLKAEGYDGVIVQNSYADGVEGQFFEVVAFSPTQIKSVNNRGTWDAGDARILYQSGGGLSEVEAVASAAGVALSVNERGGIITVSKIVSGNRGEGAGTRVMQALADYADATGQRIALTPSADFGGSVSRLREFYKRFGFVENKGRNKDFETRETMIRNPKAAGRLLFQGSEGYSVKPPKKLWRGTVTGQQEDGAEGLGTFMLGKGLYSSPDKNFAAMYGTPQEVRITDAWPRNPLVLKGQASGPDLFRDYVMRNSGFRNMREFNKAYPDPADWVRSLGHDGVIAGGEVVKYPEQPGAPSTYNQGPRGLIQIGADGQSVIRLFETANLSTMLHESGHFFLTVMQDLAAKGEGQSVADYEAIKGWWRENAADVARDGNRAMPDAKLTAEDVQRAIDTGSTGDVVKDDAIDVGMQEQWARAFEAYLMEGKAPNVELRSAFEKFRAWLVSIYQRIAGLNVKISDDIRAVFDRMLATDAEIAKARQATGEGGPVFASAEEMGLTQEEYDRFLKLRGQAEDEAKARLMREIMEPIKREREKWFRDEKAKVQEEVERNVNAMPVFRALEWMGNRRWLGEGQPEALPDIRLSRKSLVDRYGEGVLKTLRRGKQTVYAVEGGIDPDDAAGWFGFNSGDELVKALERAPNRAEAIKAETDRVMNERHGDALQDGEVEQIALDAVHGDKKGQWIAAELEAVRKVIGGDVSMTAKEARASASQTVARMRVRDAVAANRFLAAERKAAEEAYQLAGKLTQEGYWETRAKFMATSPDGRPVPNARQSDMVAKLYSAKRRQLMNHALYMEARAVADEIGKAERFVQKLNKASTREKIAGAGRRENAQTDYLAALDDILDRYDFRKMSGRSEQRRGALAAFVDAMKAAGRENELSIPEAVLRDAGRKPYKTISVEELRGVVDSLKNIEHIALRWNDLIDAVNKRKLDEVVSDITAAFDANMPKRPPGRVATAGEGLRNAGRQFLDLVLNAGTILREIDGFKDMGAAYRNLKAPIDQAMDRLIVRKEKAAADLEALYAVYSKEDRRRMAVREHIPSLGYALSKWERIAVALNTGNEGNMQRLTDPKVRGSLTPAQVKAVLATLDARDADFIQSVWDYVGSFRDDIAAREKRATGVEPQWVEASLVDIGGKTLKGGYYPLKYDPRLSSLARDDEAQSMAEALQAGRFGKAQTKRGHLEARAQSSGRDVELDMSVLHRHVNQVIYDLELSEPVANSWKVLQSGGVRQAFMDAGRQADFDALETWLKDVAEGQLNAGDWINKNARRFKSNFTAAKLAFNLGTVAAQITGLSQTMVVVGKRDFVRGLQASARLGVADEIAMKSSFMASRRTTFNKDIYDFYADPKMGPVASRWGDIKKEWIGPASFWLMTKVQWTLVDIPTWLAGYHQGLRNYGNDEAKAVAHADAIVKRAQASGLFSDRSAIERGSVSRTTRQNDVVRLFTTLGSYMFAKFNVAYERTMVAGRTVRQEGVSLKSAQEAASWALDVAFLFTLEAVFMAAIKGKLPDDDDDDDAGWAKFLAKETAMSVLGTIPFVRDVASVGSGFEGGGAYGGITAEVAKPFQEISQGEIDKGFVKSVISGTGLFTGLPATQINRAVDAGWRAAEGEDVSVLEYLLGKRGK